MDEFEKNAGGDRKFDQAVTEIFWVGFLVGIASMLGISFVVSVVLTVLGALW